MDRNQPDIERFFPSKEGWKKLLFIKLTLVKDEMELHRVRKHFDARTEVFQVMDVFESYRNGKLKDGSNLIEKCLASAAFPSLNHFSQCAVSK